MQREDSTGEGGPIEQRIRVEVDAGASFGGSVTQSKQRRGIWDSGGADTVLGPVKEMLSESVGRCGDGKKRTSSCTGIGVASVQGRRGGSTGEGKVLCRADGGRVADGS